MPPTRGVRGGRRAHVEGHGGLSRVGHWSAVCRSQWSWSGVHGPAWLHPHSGDVRGVASHLGLHAPHHDGTMTRTTRRPRRLRCGRRGASRMAMSLLAGDRTWT
eukprot:3465136-Pyramimonas_sp.AAC.1